MELMDYEHGSKEQEDLGRESDMDTDWTIGLLENRDKVDGELRKSLRRVSRTEGIKRRDDSTGGKRSKRRKYDQVGEDWGVTGREQGIDLFLYSGLEGVRRDEGRAAGGGSRMTSKEVSLKRAATMSRKLTEWVKSDEQQPQDKFETDKISENETLEIVENMCAVSEVDQAMCVPAHNDVRSVHAQNDARSVKQKVWTKKKNGLYGWKILRTRLAKISDLKQTPGAGTPASALGQGKWVPANMGISSNKTGNEKQNQKRKYTFEGGGDSILGKKSKSLDESEEQKNVVGDEMNGEANLV